MSHVLEPPTTFIPNTPDTVSVRQWDGGTGFPNSVILLQVGEDTNTFVVWNRTVQDETGTNDFNLIPAFWDNEECTIELENIRPHFKGVNLIRVQKKWDEAVEIAKSKRPTVHGLLVILPKTSNDPLRQQAVLV